MLRSGPIALWLHNMVEYLTAALLIVTPFTLDFRSDTATWLSVAMGVVVLVVAVLSESSAGPIAAIPVRSHVVLDYVLAAFLITAPFLLGFSDENAPTAWFIAIGAVQLLVTLGTRFIDDPDAVGSLARGTSVDIEAGEHTVLDD